MKGSFYATVISSYLQNLPSASPADLGNISPQAELLPAFKKTFEELYTLIIDTGLVVARLCDRYAREHMEEFAPQKLESIIRKRVSC